MAAGGNATGRWLWVTTPEFYAKEDSSDAIEEGEDDGWWTCSPKTREGDLALLYRTAPRKDVAYLFLAKTDAFSIHDDYAVERNWQGACDYEILYKFDDPIPLKALRATKELWNWSALRG
jgi:hypothetical protein